MKRAVIFLILFVPFLCKGQTEFAPIGAEWIFNYSFEGNEGYQRISVQSDTIIDERNCKKLRWEKVFANQINPVDTTYQIEGYRFLHQAGDTIYYYDNIKEQFTILFRFDVQVGDTITVPGSGYHSFYTSPARRVNFTFRVDSISTTTINGIEGIKVIHTFPDCNLLDVFLLVPKTFIERIGTTDFLFFNEIECDSPHRFKDWSLRCYSDAEITYRQVESACDFITSNQVVNKLQPFKIYPNPTSQYLFVEPIELAGQITVFDAYGRLVKHFPVSNSNINISDLPRGLYWISIKDKYKDTSYTYRIAKN